MSALNAVYKTALLVSLDAQKIVELNGQWPSKELREKLIETVRRLAAELRGVRGVRHAEAVVFSEWWEAIPEGEKKKPVIHERAPWMPCGALLLVEAPSEGQLRESIGRVFEIAMRPEFDQKMMKLMAIDWW